MQPLPEVRTATDKLRQLTGDDSLLDGLELLSTVAVMLVPSVIGVSLTVVVDDEPFTVTATDAATAAVDAVQYLDGGPCLDATFDQEAITVADILDEDRWQFYRHAASTNGVRASLSLPLVGQGGQIPGAINFYASEPAAFAGKEDLLAGVFQSPAGEYVTNADLSFMTREAARHLPERIEDKATVDQAVGVLSVTLGCSPDEARRRLRAAASKAGTPVVEVADTLISLVTL